MKGNNRGKGKGNNGGGLRGVLKIRPYRRATPKAMCHNVLKVHIIIISQGGPRPSKSMEPMASERDTKVHQNLPEAILEGSVNNKVEWWGVMNKEGGGKGNKSGLDKFLKGHTVGLNISGIWTK